MAENKDKILCFFTGSKESCLAALQAAKNTKIVYLLTFDRFGLKIQNFPLFNLHRLEKVFPNIKITHYIENIGKEFKTLAYEKYISNLFKYGFMNLSVCGFCRLAMHWKTISFCKKNNIFSVYEGIENPNRFIVMPTENPSIISDQILDMYKENGIEYINPLVNKTETLNKEEEDLFSSYSLQNNCNNCPQHLLFEKFLNIYSRKFSRKDYEAILKQFYTQKMKIIRKRLKNEYN